MTEDVNAAVRGAFDGGAKEVFVTDGHASGSNILIEELDPRASLNTGSPSPLSMVQGVDEVDGVLFVGYHARAGSPDGILDHTWSSRTVANVWLNDILVGEYGLNAAVAGHFDVPVLMVTGDQTACMQTVELLGDLETVVVKHATGRYSAECLPPKIAQGMIQKAAAKAVGRLAKRKASCTVCSGRADPAVGGVLQLRYGRPRHAYAGCRARWYLCFDIPAGYGHGLQRLPCIGGTGFRVIVE